MRKLFNYLPKLRIKEGLISKDFSYRSYSQLGEDMIIRFLLHMLKLENGIFLDVGAFHPYKFSNTMFLYEIGWRGINVEANPQLIELFYQCREGDINLNCGVMDISGELDFYIMSSPTMSTFSKEGAQELVEEHGFTLLKTVKVQVRTIMDIIHQHARPHLPDILFIDVEGTEKQILNSIDFSIWKPSIICCETVPYSTSGIPEKDNKLIKLLEDNGYFLFADTFLNSVFVYKEDLIKRTTNR